MNPEQLQILAVELAKLDYQLMSDLEAANELNLEDIATPSPANRVAIKNLKGLTMVTPIAFTAGGAANLWYVIKTKSAAGVVPMAILFDLFTDPDFQTIDFIANGIQSAMFAAGLDNLIADESLIFGEADKAAITTQVMGLIEIAYSSIADGLGLPTVAELDVNRARYSHGN